MKWLTFVVLLLLSAPILAQDASTDQRVDTYIRSEMQKTHIPGLSLAVVENGRIVKVAGYGLANVETHTPATPNTVYKIGSVSKQFLAAGIMLLVQEGKLHLHDKVSSYIDGTPASWKDISIEQLLTHTAGLPLDPPDFAPFQQTPDAVVVKSLYDHPLLYSPGSEFRYSNMDYFVIAEIINKVSGTPWDQFLARYLFMPLGMSATRTTTTTDLVPQRANGYIFQGGALKNAPNWIAVRPSGAFLSNVLDLARWDADLYKNKPLTAASLSEMWKPVLLQNGTSIPYGFGWGLSPWHGHRRVFHDGGIPGFSSDFERFIDDGLTVVVLTNCDGIDASEIALGVAAIYLLKAKP
jgi:D-alanyl-D-alanine carboxypeptidase